MRSHFKIELNGTSRTKEKLKSTRGEVHHINNHLVIVIA